MRADDGTAAEPTIAATGSPGPGADPGTDSGDDGSVGDRRGAFTGGLWNAASTVAPLAGTLALSIIISRELGADVLGEQSLVAFVSSMMISVVIMSFTTASVQLLASAGGSSQEARRAWLSRWSFRAHLAGGGLSAGILVGIGLGREQYSSLWMLAAVTTFVDAVGWAYAARDISRNGWTRTSARRLVAQAIGPVAGIVAIYAGLGVRGVFIAQLVVSLCLLVALRMLDRGIPGATFRDHAAPAWRPVVGLWSMFALGSVISQIVDRRLELLFLDRYDDVRTVAMYSVAFSLVSIPSTLTGSLIHGALPAIASRHAEEPEVVTAALSRTARVVVTMNLLVVAGTMTIGPGAVLAAYGEDFTEAATLVRWLGLALLVAPLGQLYITLWSGIGRLRPVLVAGGTAAVVDIALAWLLIPPFSTTGAVIATVTAQTVSAVLLIIHTYRSGIRLELSARRVLRSAVVAGAGAGAALACQSLVPGVVGELLAVPAFCLVIALGARFIGLFDARDTEWLASTVPGPAARLVRVLAPTR